MIREYESRDAVGAAALIDGNSPWLSTPAGHDHEVRTRPPRAKRRSWVAEEEGEIVGWGEAEFEWWTEVPDAAALWKQMKALGYSPRTAWAEKGGSVGFSKAVGPLA